QETRILNAIKAYRDGQISSVRQAAISFKVPRSTLQDRINNVPTRKTAHEHQQRLTVKEEDSIAKSARLMASWGWPMTITAIRAFATNLLESKG
ncbi:uncharacterized protein BCR38DRAFT_296168, partial [Pseudomassariella vexata]